MCRFDFAFQIDIAKKFKLNSFLCMSMLCRKWRDNKLLDVSRLWLMAKWWRGCWRESTFPDLNWYRQNKLCRRKYEEECQKTAPEQNAHLLIDFESDSFHLPCQVSCNLWFCMLRMWKVDCGRILFCTVYVLLRQNTFCVTLKLKLNLHTLIISPN